MLIIGIPTFNEAPTVGLVLWRIRKVFEEYGREYALLVLDDGSTDHTTERLRPYTDVLPLTLLRHEQRRGYAASIERLMREAVSRTRYPRRDAMIVMQADFTDQPEHIPELAKRFEGGADVVVGERRTAGQNAPDPVRRFYRLAPWLLRPFVRVERVTDLVGGFRLMRVTVVRDLLREASDGPLLQWNGSAANAELLLRAVRHSRRTETVELEPRYDLRQRPTRVRPFASALDLYRFGRAARAGRILSPSAPPSSMSIRTRSIVLAAARSLLAALVAAPYAASLAAQAPARSTPFGVGERLLYEVRFGPIRVGDGRLEITELDSIRNRPAWHAIFSVTGGTFAFHVKDRYETWIDTAATSSLRFVMDLDEGRHERERDYHMFPDKRVFTEGGGPERPSVADPLDEISFLYYARTLPLEVGKSYRIDRYFKPDRNPVILRVLRKERVHVPAGTFDAIVVQPIIKTSGIFSEDGEAQVWFTDDDRRLLIQMKSKLKFGSLNLYLTSFRTPTPPNQTP